MDQLICLEIVRIGDSEATYGRTLAYVYLDTIGDGEYEHLYTEDLIELGPARPTAFSPPTLTAATSSGCGRRPRKEVPDFGVPALKLPGAFPDASPSACPRRSLAWTRVDYVRRTALQRTSDCDTVVARRLLTRRGSEQCPRTLSLLDLATLDVLLAVLLD